MTATADYGVLFRRGTGVAPYTFTTIAQATVVGIPTITQVMAEYTNHGSGGWREFIAGRLRTIEAFTVNLAWDMADATHIALLASFNAGTAEHFRIVYATTPAVNWSFDGLIEKWAPQAEDAQNPKVITLVLTIRPTGANAIT